MTVFYLIVTGLLAISVFLSLFGGSRRLKSLCGLLTGVFSVVSVGVFFHLQSISGGADRGMALMQVLLPVIVYSLAALLGVVTFLRNK